jgi:hypothetical protein
MLSNIPATGRFPRDTAFKNEAKDLFSHDVNKLMLVEEDEPEKSAGCRYRIVSKDSTTSA